MRRLCRVVYQNSGIMVAQTTMQYGQSAPIRYSAWYISQVTKPIPNTVPAWRPSQNQRRYVAPASRPAPIAITTAKPTRPSSELGKPKASAWSLRMIEPQLMIGLMLQLGTYDGSSSSRILSSVRTAEAKIPIAPPISSRSANGRLAPWPRAGAATVPAAVTRSPA